MVGVGYTALPMVTIFRTISLIVSLAAMVAMVAMWQTPIENRPDINWRRWRDIDGRRWRVINRWRWGDINLLRC